MDGEGRLSSSANWEEQCVDAAEYELNSLEEKLAAEREVNSQRIWLSFQNAANAVAQLFRERGEVFHGSSLWAPFQDTANLVTVLYKDSVDMNKRNFEAGYQIGHKKRNREVIAWAKKKKRSIRRDELLSYLSGRSPPRYQRGDSVEDRASEDVGNQCTNAYNALHNPLLPPVVPAVGFTSWTRRKNSRTDNYDDDIGGCELFRDTRKRSLSSQDVVMDSSIHKKCKFL